MTNIHNYKTVYIHNNEFNTDDVIAVALIKFLNPNITIQRVNNIRNINDDELVLGFNQETDYTKNSNKRDNKGNLYSYASFIFEQCADELFTQAGIQNITLAKDYFYNKYIKNLAKGTRDNYFNCYMCPENNTILNFNTYWYESYFQKLKSNSQFNKAIEFASILLENWLRDTKEEVDLRQTENKIWDDATKSSQKGIYILEKCIPWQYQIKKHPDTDAKMIIYKGKRGGYHVVSKESKEIKVIKNEYLSFIHPSGFMGVADTLEHAILVANASLNHYSAMA